MKYRVFKKETEHWNFSQYFYTKKEAIAFQIEYGGQLQRKIGNDWINC